MMHMRRGFATMVIVALFSAVYLAWAGVDRSDAGSVPSAALRSFSFPLSFANGVLGDLISPAGNTSNLHIEGVAKVAVGELPVPLPQRAGRHARGSRAPGFVRPANAGPYVRLLLNGVMDTTGHPANNTGNQLVIDAVVSPGNAVTSGPPFSFSFDIANGGAFLSVALPIQAVPGSPVRVQILGVTVIDPDGQPFGILGFEVPPARQTPVPSMTPTPGGTPASDGQCFVGSDCSGPSFVAPQAKCCRLVGPERDTAATTSWCAADQFDPTTGQCLAGSCIPCAPPTPAASCGDRAVCAGRCTVQCPDGHLAFGACQQAEACACTASCEQPPTPTPGPCAGGEDCSGNCTVTCADGTTVAGQCTGARHGQCACSAQCNAPTPCAVGQCFDTITFRCTGHSCGADAQCPLPNQFCDLGGRRCPCGGPVLPHGRICCQCKDPASACFEISFVEVQPICPFGCDTFVGQECDEHQGTCSAPTPCTADSDCDDGNGCTIDRCTPDGCTHDCVCVGPDGCGPGPSMHH